MGLMIAVTLASFGREALLRRLLISLRPCPALAGCRLIIVNNGRSSIDTVLAETGWADATVLTPGSNQGCAGGLALAIAEALRDDRVRQCLIMDDDATVEPDAPARLRGALESTGGALAAPLITNAAGEVGWFPGLQDRRRWRVIKRPGLRPAEYLAECGPGLVRITWAAWPVLMVDRAAIERNGLPMRELWYQGVDLEYTLRLTAREAGYFVPEARAWHIPPAITWDRRFFLRECGGLQNSFFVFLRLPHGRRALRHLPGNLYRFLRCWGWRPRVLADVARAFWWGAVRARPQGAAGFDYFRRCWERAAPG